MRSTAYYLAHRNLLLRGGQTVDATDADAGASTSVSSESPVSEDGRAITVRWRRRARPDRRPAHRRVVSTGQRGS